jgi:hypothetical protein
VALLQILQILLVYFYGALQLFDILCPSLSERGLRLSVPLFALFGGRVYLSAKSRQPLHIFIISVALLARWRTSLRLPVCVLLSSSAVSDQAPEHGGSLAP